MSISYYYHDGNAQDQQMVPIRGDVAPDILEWNVAAAVKIYKKAAELCRGSSRTKRLLNYRQ